MKIAAYFTLSGNTKPYAYAVDDQALTNVSPGDRAVLVNKRTAFDGAISGRPGRAIKRRCNGASGKTDASPGQTFFRDR